MNEEIIYNMDNMDLQTAINDAIGNIRNTDQENPCYKMMVEQYSQLLKAQELRAIQASVRISD